MKLRSAGPAAMFMGLSMLRTLLARDARASHFKGTVALSVYVIMEP